MADRRTLAIKPDTPPGDYAILTGMYLPDSGTRLDVRDAAGNPTGILIDHAQNLVASKIPPPTPADTLRRMLAKVEEYSESHRAHGLPDDLLNILKDDLYRPGAEKETPTTH